MPQSPKGNKKTTKQPVNPVLLLSMTALDTTWRTFVPVVGGTVAGVAIDNSFGIAPLTTIVGLVIGVAIATLLVIKQMKDVNKPL